MELPGDRDTAVVTVAILGSIAGLILSVVAIARPAGCPPPLGFAGPRTGVILTVGP